MGREEERRGARVGGHSGPKAPFEERLALGVQTPLDAGRKAS
jgi:hypothetical protein